VEKVNPDLVVCDKEGKPYTVRYDQVNVMLLNESLKEHREVEAQDRKTQEQNATIAQLKSGIETLTAMVKEQAARIGKVSDQLVVSKSAPQIVLNNR
jgi:cell division protein FtsB